MKPVLLIDFGSTNTKLTAVDLDEERILGTAAKMFIISGPVIVFGTAASVVYGIVYWVAIHL